MVTAARLITASFCLLNVVATVLWVKVFQHQPLSETVSPPEVGPYLIPILTLWFLGTHYVVALVALMLHAMHKHRTRPATFAATVAACVITFIPTAALGLVGFIFFVSPGC